MHNLKTKNINLISDYNLETDVTILLTEYLSSSNYNFPVIITTSNNTKYIIFLLKVSNSNAFYEVKHYPLKQLNTKKNKYQKQVYKLDKIKKDIKVIGLNNAKQIHAQDLVTYKYIPLKEYLNKHRIIFGKTELYFRDNKDQYNILRHKNLFSEYVDEISDFERLTYIERSENKMLKIRSSNDSKILEYNYLASDLLQRKFAREFAKLIYNYKSGFKDKELLDFLKDQAVYIKVETTIPKDSKLVWDNILIDEMKSNILDKEVNTTYKDRKTKKGKYYMSKRNKRRKARRNSQKILKLNMEQI